MNRKILFTVVFCLSSFYHTFSQTTFSLPFGDYYLFTHQDKYYILDTKKLYETTDGVNWSEREHHLDFTKVELGHLNLDSNTTYLFYRSGGNAYTFDGKQFKAIYSKGEFRNQHHSFPFLYKQMPHLFGGYGLFTLKNIITYLVPETSNWEYIPYYGEEENQPKPRSKPMAQQDGDELYIGLGFNLNTLSTKSDEHNYLKDFWKFNFKTRVWKKLGTSNLVSTNGKMDNEASFLSNYIIGPQNKVVFTNFNRLYFADIAHNKLYFYPNNKLPQNYIQINNIVYNPQTDKFFYIVLNADKLFIPTIISSTDLRGKTEIVTELYQADNLYIYYWIALVAVLGVAGGYFWYLKQKENKAIQSIFKKIEINMEEIQAQLNSEHRIILNIIYKSYPDNVTYTTLMGIYGNKYSYDTIKKHLKEDLEEIDEKIKKIIGEKESIFIIDKRDEDKRMKEVGFRKK